MLLGLCAKNGPPLWAHRRTQPAAEVRRLTGCQALVEAGNGNIGLLIYTGRASRAGCEEAGFTAGDCPISRTNRPGPAADLGARGSKTTFL